MKTQPKVKAAAVGADVGCAAVPIVQIAAHYLAPVVPADIREPVILLPGMAVTAGLSALGAWWACYRAPDTEERLPCPRARPGMPDLERLASYRAERAAEKERRLVAEFRRDLG